MILEEEYNLNLAIIRTNVHKVWVLFLKYWTPKFEWNLLGEYYVPPPKKKGDLKNVDPPHGKFEEKDAQDAQPPKKSIHPPSSSWCLWHLT